MNDCDLLRVIVFLQSGGICKEGVFFEIFEGFASLASQASGVFGRRLLPHCYIIIGLTGDFTPFGGVSVISSTSSTKL
jgi:hypothetical protein